MRNPLPIVVFCTGFLCAGLAGQDGVAEGRLDEALAALRAAKTLDDAAVGYAGAKTATYQAYEQLCEFASVERLTALTADPSPIVRCYAIRALAAAPGKVDLLELVLAHLGDIEPVETFRGCLRGTEKTGDAMIDAAWSRLSDAQRLVLVERAIVDGSALYARERALREMVLPDRLAGVLLEAARVGGGGPELIALARMKHASAPGLIEGVLASKVADLQYLNDALRAAALLPDVRYVVPLRGLTGVLLRRLHNDAPARARFWVEAVAALGSDTAADMLGELWTNAASLSESRRRGLATVLRSAIASRPEPAFDDVRAALGVR